MIFPPMVFQKHIIKTRWKYVNSLDSQINSSGKATSSFAHSLWIPSYMRNVEYKLYLNGFISQNEPISFYFLVDKTLTHLL